VERGPYLQMATPNSMTIKWSTEAEVQGRVLYGEAEDQLAKSVTASAATLDHELQLQNLKPDTRYYYQVEGNDGPSQDVHSFVTPPPVGTKKPTRVWVVGDSGSADIFAHMVKESFYTYNESTSADLWLMLGDNAYTTGTQDEYQKAVFEMYPRTLPNTVLWPTQGNHDVTTVDGTGPYYDIFTLPTQGEAGGVPSGTEAYYSFDYANIHFICLNSQISNPAVGGAMYNWVVADLQATQQDWIVVFFHHPPYSKSSHDSDTEGKLRDMRTNFTPLFDEYGVDMVFAGHSHAYERSYPVRGHTGTSDTFQMDMITQLGDGREDGDGAYLNSFTHGEDGVVYTVAGSSSRLSYSGSFDHPVHFASLRQFGSVVLDFDDNRVDATFVTPIFGVRDYFTIIKK